MKKLFILIFVLVAACSSKDIYSIKLGGEKDKHGCYTMAGYSWCESKQKCIRIWEEDCPEEPY